MRSCPRVQELTRNLTCRRRARARRIWPPPRLPTKRPRRASGIYVASSSRRSAKGCLVKGRSGGDWLAFPRLSTHFSGPPLSTPQLITPWRACGPEGLRGGVQASRWLSLLTARLATPTKTPARDGEGSRLGWELARAGCHASQSTPSGKARGARCDLCRPCVDPTSRSGGGSPRLIGWRLFGRTCT